ncbi:MAG: siroheme synthase CysG [Pseudomonadota bacterium]|nr:siroheme synthase CysG [Pseudomonadota bacterium]
MSSPRSPVETSPVGLEPLAVLPVFVRLQGRRAVLAGGNAGAAWKAKLLAAAGATVHVFAPRPSSVMRNAPSEVAAGAVVIHERAWRRNDLAGAAFAVAAGDDDDECAAFVEAAREAGAIVNAVDRPHLCDVQFGAIVNRSPLVVGISTDGAAPAFGQAVRSRIESLLPRGFSSWVAAAKVWREKVASTFADFGSRREFWRLFAERAEAEADRAPTEQDLASLIASACDSSRTQAGSVLLVGAGPGDPELLTLRAVRALRTADVILYDDLVAPEILDFARREARIMLVGKTGHGPSCRQDDINALIVKLAGTGKRVVRLKGGDPLVFGRAAEEIEHCRAAGVPVAVIPGVTSAQGAAASLLLPLTQRSIARRIQFITGHDRAGTLPPDTNWQAIADPTAVTAIYMPKRTLAALLRKAIDCGLPPHTPALAIYNATRADQHIESGTAANLAELVAASSAAGPAMVLVGEAIRHSLRDAGAQDAIAT